MHHGNSKHHVVQGIAISLTTTPTLESAGRVHQEPFVEKVKTAWNLLGTKENVHHKRSWIQETTAGSLELHQATLSTVQTLPW